MQRIDKAASSSDRSSMRAPWVVVIAVATRLAPARAGGAADEVPKAPAVVAEPAVESWERSELGTVRRFEPVFEASPIGWRFDGDGNGYLAMARIGPGFRWAGTSGLTLAYATYEISPISPATFGLHASYIPGGWSTKPGYIGFGAGAGALVDIDGRFGAVASLKVLAVFGLEVQLRDTDHGFTAASYLTFQVPMRMAACGLGRSHDFRRRWCR
jgi:hypothetical protein